jgi:hypothetical protein
VAVSSTGEAGAQQQLVRCAYLVAADGSHSSIRCGPCRACGMCLCSHPTGLPSHTCSHP